MAYEAMLGMVLSGRVSPDRLVGLVEAIPRIVGMDADTGRELTIIDRFA